MITILIVILLCIVIGIALYELIQVDAGYVLISVGETTIESSFWFAFFAVVLGFICVWLCYYFIAKILRTLGRGGRWFSDRHHAGIERRYREGLLHFLVGDYEKAQKYLQSVSRRPELPVVRAIATAQAKAKLNQGAEALRLLNTASDQYPEDDIWLAYAKVQVLTDLGQFDDAQAQIAFLKERKPHDKHLRKLEHKMLVASGSWSEALTISSQVGKRQSLAEGDFVIVFLNNLVALSDEASVKQSELDALWEKTPKELKTRPEFTLAYVKVLEKIGDEKAIESFILKSIKQVWNADLADIYIKLEHIPADQRLKQLEQWKSNAGESEQLFLLLGIMCVKNQLWGKAKSYLEKSLAISESAKTLYMLGFLAEKMGDEKLSLDYYRRSAGMNQK